MTLFAQFGPITDQFLLESLNGKGFGHVSIWFHCCLPKATGMPIADNKLRWSESERS